MKKLITAFLLGALLVSSNTAWAELVQSDNYITTNLTRLLGESEHPDVYGEFVVYDRFGRNSDIYLYNLITKLETPLIQKLGSQNSPAIYDNKVVYVDDSDGDPNIYMYDLILKKETPICVAPDIQCEPRIYGNTIVWTDYRNGNSDIYMYDLSTKEETQLTNDPSLQENPAIYSDKIVWSDCRDDVYDIYMYNTNTKQETPLVVRDGYQRHPDISGDLVVWDDLDGRPDTSHQIMVMDLTTQETKVLTNDEVPVGNFSPKINGDYIVWEKGRRTMDSTPTGRIQVYNLSTNQLQLDLGDKQIWQHSPVISDGHLLWTGEEKYNVNTFLLNLSLQGVAVSMTVGKPSMQVNSVTVPIDPGRATTPLVVQGRTLIPVRGLVEALGGHTYWDAKENKVTIIITGKRMDFWIGKKQAMVDGQSYNLDVAPQVINGRTMMPIRFIAENLGLEVEWNSQWQQITISDE